MSVMNDALSTLNRERCIGTTIDGVTIKPATINNVQSRSRLIWLTLGFCLSLAVGGWAASFQSIRSSQSNDSLQVVGTSNSMTHPSAGEASYSVLKQTASNLQLPSSAESELVSKLQVNPLPKRQLSPTQKVVDTSEVDHFVYPAPIPELPIADTSKSPAILRPSLDVQATANSETTTRRVMSTTSAESRAVPQPLPQERAYVRRNMNTNTSTSKSSMVIEQVELSPSQLASKAVSRAERALDNNELNEALQAYSEALRYRPSDEYTRQKLAALYYGKGDARKAFRLLQDGIKLNNDGERLRIALTKLLMKEDQTEAALVPLVFLPNAVSVEYLSLRAALAQKNKRDDIALESYQRLIHLDVNNARWWLGLAIIQERTSEPSTAIQSYQQALTKVGISSQSQQFIQKRLSVLNHSEAGARAN